MATDFTTQPPVSSTHGASSGPQGTGKAAKRQDLPAAAKVDQASSATGAGLDAAAQGQDAASPVDRGQLNNAVSRLQDYVQSIQRDFEFSVDEDSGRTVVKVVDNQTQEVIRQIPPEIALKLAEDFGELRGILFQEEA